MVRRWRRQFLEGRTDISDKPRSGRPWEITEDTVNTVRCLIEEDGWRTTREIEHYLAEEALTPISHPTICKILHNEWGLSKVCARWVPKLLTDEHKQNRMAAIIEFLSQYHAEGQSLFDRIVTGNEKWIHHFTPETKQASMVWRLVDKPTPVKAKRERDRREKSFSRHFGIRKASFWKNTLSEVNGNEGHVLRYANPSLPGHKQQETGKIVAEDPFHPRQCETAHSENCASVA